MSKELKPLNEIKGSDTNPFVLELKGKMFLQPRANSIIARGQQIVDTNTGEVVRDDVLIGRRKVVDKSQFSKLYASEIGVLFELSRSAVNVFIHLTKVMDYDNKAIFDYTKEFAKVGYKTHKQCLLGLRELIAKGIIYPHLVSGVWWLNPTLVCRGERFAKYTEYVTQERHERDAKKRIQQSELKEQGKEWYDNIDDQTKHQLDVMNEDETDRLTNAYENGEDLYPPM